MVAASGLIAAVFSAVLNGTFGLFGKVSSVQKAQVPAAIFNFWMSCGIVLSSLLTLIAQPLAWTPWGLLSGALFVLSTACTFFAINRLGLSSAAGIWSGTAILVSFTFGVRFQGEVIKKGGLAAGGLVALVLGLGTIAVNGALAGKHREAETHHGHDEEGGMGSSSHSTGASAEEVDGKGNGKAGVKGRAAVDSTDVGEAGAGPAAQTAGKTAYFATGLALAVATGFFGGLVLAPFGHTGLGINFVPSMAVGVVVAAPIITTFLLLVSKQPFRFYPREAALPGIAAGCLWNGGNVLSIVATRDPGVGLAVAYPILQCGLLVAGFWGIILYRELKGREQIPFWVGGLVVIIGATMLAVAK